MPDPSDMTMGEVAKTLAKELLIDLLRAVRSGEADLDEDRRPDDVPGAAPVPVPVSHVVLAGPPLAVVRATRHGRDDGHLGAVRHRGIDRGPIAIHPHLGGLQGPAELVARPG